MGNKPYAIEWMQFSYRNMLTGKHLFEVNHFTDIIVVDLQQSLEKMLKAILANENRKISRTHNLDELYSLVQDKITLSDKEIGILEKATDYYREDRYPNPNYTLPSKEETEEILRFTENLFNEICSILSIKKEEFIKN